MPLFSCGKANELAVGGGTTPLRSSSAPDAPVLGALAGVGGRVLREVDQQSSVRDPNEVIEPGNVGLPVGRQRRPLRRECGDPSCTAQVDVVVGDARYAVLARNPRHAWVARA
jgi:hypothetical protein